MQLDCRKFCQLMLVHLLKYDGGLALELDGCVLVCVV